MTNAPIRVGGQPLPDSVIQGTTRSPIVPLNRDSNSLIQQTVAIKQSIYRVKLTSNGKTFNMLLPPSIETKHPGKSNPLQMPGLQIEASAAISKLKIPGFFPIYQHLGVETLTVSMSGMFTGYDGTDTLANASEWEGWKDLTIKEGQDSYAAANELYEFAVRNKSLIEVIIYTSDGSFTPREKSTATTFRDSQSNIRFKGYIKDFKQIYVRQDRNYYMLKFEIIDLTQATCKSISNKTDNNTNKTSPITFGKKIDQLTNQEIIDIQKVLNKKGLYRGPINGQNTAAFQSVIDFVRRQFNVDVDNNGIYTGTSQSDKNSPNKNSTDLARLLDVIIDNPGLSTNTNISSNTTTNTSNNSNNTELTPSNNPTPIQQQAQINRSQYSKDFSNKFLTSINNRQTVSATDINKYFNYPPFKNQDIYVTYLGSNKTNKSILEIKSTTTGLRIGTYIAIPDGNKVRLDRY